MPTRSPAVEAEADQPGGHVAHRFGVVVPGGGLPLLADPAPQCRPRSVPGGVVPEDVDDGASHGVIGHGITLPSGPARHPSRRARRTATKVPDPAPPSPHGPPTAVRSGSVALVANHKKTKTPRKPQRHLPKVGTPADNAYRQKRGRQDVVDFGLGRGRGRR